MTTMLLLLLLGVLHLQSGQYMYFLSPVSSASRFMALYSSGIKKKESEDRIIIHPDEYMRFDTAICQEYEKFALPKPRVEDPVYYVSGKFRVGANRWENALASIGCRVLLSGAIPPENIRITRDNVPQSILNNTKYQRHMKFVEDETHESRRGAGYWFWKPLVNLAVLHEDNVPNGAYIVYGDGDRPDVIGFAGDVIEEMARHDHDFAIQQAKGGRAWTYTKGDTFFHFGFSNSSRDWDGNRQYAANFFVYRKSAEMVRFFTEWARLMEDYHQVSDEPSIIPSRDFQDNRHDQTMLDMLIKYGYRDGSPEKRRVPIDMSGRPHVSAHQWEWLSSFRTYTLSLERSALSVFQHGRFRNASMPNTKPVDLVREPFDMRWDEMESLQEAATLIGYDKSKWDSGSKHSKLPLHAIPFANLTESKKQAVVLLETEYNFYYDHVPDDYAANILYSTDGTMAISRENSLLYVHIPKTGGSTIESSYLFNDARSYHQIGGHHTIGAMAKNAEDRQISNFVKAAHVRHPCDRFVSAFAYLTSDLCTHLDKEWANTYIGSKSIDDFVLELEQKHELLQWAHFTPMWHYVFQSDGTYGIDATLCQESWDESLNKLKDLNLQIPDALYTNHALENSHSQCEDLIPETRATIKRIYRMDYCVFQFDDLPPKSCPQLNISPEEFTERYQTCDGPMLKQIVPVWDPRSFANMLSGRHR